VCGPRDFIVEARRGRKMFGGGMRQVGVLAAAGLVALRKGPRPLAEDHAPAALLAPAVAPIPRAGLRPPDPGAHRPGLRPPRPPPVASGGPAPPGGATNPFPRRLKGEGVPGGPVPAGQAAMGPPRRGGPPGLGGADRALRRVAPARAAVPAG